MNIRKAIFTLIIGLSIVLIGCNASINDVQETFSVQYNANGADDGVTPVDDNEYEEGSPVTIAVPGSMSRTGHVFETWNTSADGMGTSYDAGAQISMPGENLILFAFWNSVTPDPTPDPDPEPETYIVTYNSSNATSGSVPIDSTAYPAGTTVTVSGNTGSLEKTGFSFEGWSIDEAAYHVDYRQNDTFTIDSSSVTLYAVWKPVVTEYLNGVDTVRERGSVSIGDIEVGLIYAKNASTITFPITIYNNVPRTLETPFMVGETEVTNAALAKILQWAYDQGKFSSTLSDPNGLNQSMIKYGGRELFDMNDTGNLCRINYSNGRFTVEAGSEERPALRMSLYGAIMFCNWLTEMRDGNDNEVVYSGITAESWSFSEHPERSGFRLPSSIEWQYCARYLGTSVPASGDLASEYIARNVNGGPSTLTAGYYWTPGDYLSGATANYENATASSAVAVYQDNSSGGPASAATKAPNYLGLYDMSGNADEWCIEGIFDSSEYLGGGNYGNPLSSGYLRIDDPKSARTGSIMNPSYGFRITRTADM